MWEVDESGTILEALPQAINQMEEVFLVIRADKGDGNVELKQELKQKQQSHTRPAFNVAVSLPHGGFVHCGQNNKNK